MTKVLNITHAGCLDGACSTWLVRKAFPDCTILSVGAGRPLPPLPEIEGGWDLILVTDISFELEDMDRLDATGAEVELLDHHKSAFDRLGDTKWAAYLSKTMSGSLVTYNWLCDYVKDDWDEATQEIVAYHSDIDLWQFKLPRARDFLHYNYAKVRISNIEESLADLDALHAKWSANPVAVLDLGEVMRERAERQIARAADRVVWSDFMGYRNVPVVNCEADLSSEVGNYLARQAKEKNAGNDFAADFAVCWMVDTNDHFEAEIKVSFRSVTGSGNCLDLATQYGGGGHIKACGCRFKPSVWFKMLRDETGEEWT